MEKVKFITLPIEQRKQIAQELNCQPGCINAALHFRAHNSKAKMIRKRAYELGGVNSFKLV